MFTLFQSNIMNEGMATVFRTLACDLVHPHWNYFHHFIINELQPALHFDAEPDSRPMSSYVEDPDAIEKIFDVITYSKGNVDGMFPNRVLVNYSFLFNCVQIV